MKSFIKKSVSVSLSLACVFALFSCKNGEEKIIIVPGDGSNCTRALLLLQEEGYITLREGVTASDNLSDVDITDKKGYTVKLVEAQTVASQYANAKAGTIAVINGNYAIQAGLNASTDALAVESAEGDSAKTYANILCVKEGNENNEAIKALAEILTGADVAQYINETFGGAVVPMNQGE